ncbi:MAG: hypothetical protein ACYTFK_01320 [Planctomycetota bacterium]|jgi:hypothetical protein
MSEVDFESQVSSGDEAAVAERLVPVREAIRYRKRAQNAENRAAEIEEQLKASRAEGKQLADELNEARFERELLSSLTAAGAKDIEAAVLLAKARISESDGDVDSVVVGLRKEKGYLFEDAGPGGAISRTAGVKEKMSGGQSVLARAANRAAASGNRADMAEYLRVRRQFV